VQSFLGQRQTRFHQFGSPLSKTAPVPDSKELPFHGRRERRAHLDLELEFWKMSRFPFLGGFIRLIFGGGDSGVRFFGSSMAVTVPQFPPEGTPE
jgi:hypothetical protein